MTQAAIVGWGKAVPEYYVSQQEAAECLLAMAPAAIRQRAQRWRQIFEHSGIRKRHTVVTREQVADWHNLSPKTETAPAVEGAPRGEPKPQPSWAALNGELGPTTAQRLAYYPSAATALAEQAAQSALQEACTSAHEVTHLITASCTGFHAPGVDVQLIHRLGLPADVKRLHIGYMGCHAAINALRAAQGFLACEPLGCVLLCCVEVCSLHWQQISEPEKWLGNVLFADGAAALLLRSQAPADAWHLIATAGCLVPETEPLMNWVIGDHGFEMYVAPELPARLRKTVGNWLTSWLQRYGWTLRDIASWAVHPGGPKILHAVAESLGLTADSLQASWRVLAEYGNMSSPSVLFVLDELRRQQAQRPCVALAFGPGLTLEAALFI